MSRRTLLTLLHVETFKEKRLCDKHLKRADVEKLKKAIKQLYYFEFIYGTAISLSHSLILLCV